MYSENPEINNLLTQIIKTLEIEFELEESVEQTTSTNQKPQNIFGSIQMLAKIKKGIAKNKAEINPYWCSPFGIYRLLYNLLKRLPKNNDNREILKFINYEKFQNFIKHILNAFIISIFMSRQK